MPKEGFKTVTVDEELYKFFQDYCEKLRYKNIPEFLREIRRQLEKKSDVLKEVSPLR
jgi:Arc/MetJ-type ribon-helix-helix transcriptional regulator